MPELPEVETIVRDLRPHLLGAGVEGVELTRPSVLRFPDPAEFQELLQGATLGRLHRRGKFMLLPLRSLRRRTALVVHLGMTGSLTIAAPDKPAPSHTHLRLGLDGQRELRFRDPRRFGRLLLGNPTQLRTLGFMPPLGPEPLSAGFSEGPTNTLLQKSRRAVKVVLLDQRVVAGCGNIYADEACYLARIKPTRVAGDLTGAERRRLLLALREVLLAAIRRRGSSFSDYRDGFGEPGAAHFALLAYGRGGQPCVRCGEPLRLIRLAGRATVYCGVCQL